MLATLHDVGTQAIEVRRLSKADGLRLRAFLIPAVRPSDLARAAGVPRQNVSEILSGRRPPTERIVRAAADLGLPVEFIFPDLVLDPDRSGDAAAA